MWLPSRDIVNSPLFALPEAQTDGIVRLLDRAFRIQRHPITVRLLISYACIQDSRASLADVTRKVM